MILLIGKKRRNNFIILNNLNADRRILHADGRRYSRRANLRAPYKSLWDSTGRAPYKSLWDSTGRAPYKSLWDSTGRVSALHMRESALNFSINKCIKGFTFIELLFVTIILSILISIALPNFKNTYDNLRLNNIAWDIYALLGYTQDRAVSEQSILRVNIDTTTGTFELSRYENTTFVPLKEHITRKITVPPGISIQYNKEAIYFYPDGSIDGEDVLLKNKLDRLLTLKKYSYGYKIE